MCMAAIAHHYSFSYQPYARSGATQSCCAAFLAMWDVSDVQRDIQEHLGIVGGCLMPFILGCMLLISKSFLGSSISRRIRGRSMYTLARGENEYSNLVPKASSVPSGGLYQNDNDEFSYGSIENISKTEPTTPAPVHRDSDKRNFVNL